MSKTLFISLWNLSLFVINLMSDWQPYELKSSTSQTCSAQLQEHQVLTSVLVLFFLTFAVDRNFQEIKPSVSHDVTANCSFTSDTDFWLKLEIQGPARMNSINQKHYSTRGTDKMNRSFTVSLSQQPTHSTSCAQVSPGPAGHSCSAAWQGLPARGCSKARKESVWSSFWIPDI